jgi:nucleoside-diphosphate-sugar epimerase
MTNAHNGTVLVTGGTGFIAGWCIVELLKRGYAVRTTVRALAKEAAVRAAVASVVDAGDRLRIVAADLTNDDGWDAAVAGCDYVLHVASPLGGDTARDANALVAPARDGTLRVLRAATAAGITRVVMTSAAAAARPPLASNRASDETVWADPADPQFDAYRVSKILAERAAWDFMSGRAPATTFTTILPGAVFGPVLTRENLGSVKIIESLLDGRPAGLPRLGFSIVDVRDLADLHVRAMTAPEAAGQRFIAAGDFMWMEDIARTLRSRLGARAAKVPTRRLPDLVFRLVSLFQPNLRALTPLLGRRPGLTTEKARRVLGFAPRPAEATVVDCAERLLAALEP